jgi:TolB-like protein
MSSLIEGYNYDIFISYRQKDNKYDGWVTEFVDNLKKELEATFKEEISVYFDINPHDGLLETHDVDASIKDKLKCLVFIPIISRTYCDPKSFAWEHEFKAFVEQASNDQFGLKIKLPNGNFANRVLPIRIYDLENTDIKLCEAVLGGVVRGIEFIYKSAGVNRPLTPSDYPEKNQYKTFYRDQINKVANAIKENISGLKGEPLEFENEPKEVIKITLPEEKTRNKTKKVLIYSLSLLVILAAVFVTIKTNFLKKEIEKSIAVLPFRNDSPEDSTQYFMDGVMEELLNKLQSIKSLRVVGRTSVEQFRGQDKSIPMIAKELGVNYIVEGSGQKSGNSFRMRVQLIIARNERHIWGNSFEQENLDMREYFKAQSGFAEAIANELNAAMSSDERMLMEKTHDINFEVYDNYLKSRQYWGDVGKESLQKALEYLNNAIKEEPGWAPLYSGLAQVWINLQQMGFEPPSVAIPEIYNNLNKALELDPNLSEAHYLKAMIAHLVEWDWQKSEKEFLKALAVNPNDALSRALYAQLLCVLQRTDEGVTQGRLALALDPLNPYVKCLCAAILPCVGDCKTAIDIAEEVTVADPGNYLANNVIFIAAFKCKEYGKVIKAEKYNLPVFSVKEDDIKEIERIFNEEGFVKAYEKIMILLEKIAENNPISPLDMAMRYIMANQPDKAMDWLEKGFELHDPGMTYIATKIFNLDPLFNNPRFIDIVKKMNLPLPKN